MSSPAKKPTCRPAYRRMAGRAAGASILFSTMLWRPRGQVPAGRMQSLSIPPGGATQPTSPGLTRGPLRIDRLGGLFAARHEGLAVDAETTLSGFEDLHKKSPRGVGRLLRGA